MRPLSKGSHVAVWDTAVKKWTRRGLVVDVLEHQAYAVKVLNNTVIMRNRQHLIPVLESADAGELDKADLTPPREENAWQSPRRSGRRC